MSDEPTSLPGLPELWTGFVDEVNGRFDGSPPSAPPLSDDDVTDGVFSRVVAQGMRSLLGQRCRQAEDHRTGHEHPSDRIADVVLE